MYSTGTCTVIKGSCGHSYSRPCAFCLRCCKTTAKFSLAMASSDHLAVDSKLDHILTATARLRLAIWELDIHVHSHSTFYCGRVSMDTTTVGTTGYRA